MVVSVRACGVACGVAPKWRFPVSSLRLISQGPAGCSLGGLRLRQLPKGLSLAPVAIFTFP